MAAALVPSGLVDRALENRVAAVFPQPIALAVGRISRARSTTEQLDAVIRAAEVATRYCAALALSSAAARANPEEALPGDLRDGFAGDLSFGHFMTLAERLTTLAAEHPL